MIDQRGSEGGSSPPALLLLLPLPLPLQGPDREGGRREGGLRELVKLLSIPNYVVLRRGHVGPRAGGPFTAAAAAATTVQTIPGLY